MGDFSVNIPECLNPFVYLKSSYIWAKELKIFGARIHPVPSGWSTVLSSGIPTEEQNRAWLPRWSLLTDWISPIIPLSRPQQNGTGKPSELQRLQISVSKVLWGWLITSKSFHILKIPHYGYDSDDDSVFTTVEWMPAGHLWMWPHGPEQMQGSWLCANATSTPLF